MLSKEATFEGQSGDKFPALNMPRGFFFAGFYPDFTTNPFFTTTEVETFARRMFAPLEQQWEARIAVAFEDPYQVTLEGIVESGLVTPTLSELIQNKKPQVVIEGMRTTMFRCFGESLSGSAAPEAIVKFW